MTYYIVTFTSGMYCGCDSYRYIKTTMSKSELELELNSLAEEEMSMYEWLATNDIYEEDYYSKEDYNAAIDEAIEDFYACVEYDIEVVEDTTEIDETEWEEW